MPFLLAEILNFQCALHLKGVGSLSYKDMIYHFQCEQKDTFKRFEKKIESNEKRYAVYVKELV